MEEAEQALSELKSEIAEQVLLCLSFLINGD